MPRKFLAEVRFFFQIRYGNDAAADEALAYVRHLGVKKEGELYKLSGGVGAAKAKGPASGAHEVIRCADIVGLAGLIRGGDRDVFVVDEEGALWLNLVEVE